jgi:hypothetical protein
MFSLNNSAIAKQLNNYNFLDTTVIAWVLPIRAASLPLPVRRATPAHTLRAAGTRHHMVKLLRAPLHIKI